MEWFIPAVLGSCCVWIVALFLVLMFFTGLKGHN